MDEARIVKQVLAAPLIKLVNSICLQKKLKHYDVPSYIIRPGYDFGQIFPKDIRGGSENIIIGGLYREGVHGRRKRTQWLVETARTLKTRNKNIKFWLFGSETGPQGFMCDHYVRSPSIDQKNIFYNNVDIWMAPTMSEGLHLPPAEAMMTECPVVATDAELSGTQDYTIQYETGIVSNNDLKSFIECVKLLIEDEPLRLKLGKAARKKVLSLGDRKDNMEKLIEYFMGIIT
jgi:glycosyltransferase involved in cell wall biosynthesis